MKKAKRKYKSRDVVIWHKELELTPVQLDKMEKAIEKAMKKISKPSKSNAEKRRKVKLIVKAEMYRGLIEGLRKKA